MSNLPEQPRSPSLEDLLRLKRSERPDADFWQDFERGLRAKQLAAIVEPRPWWLGFSILLGKVPVAGWAASGLSAGAAAIFAIMTVLDPTSTSNSPVELAQNQPAVATSTAPRLTLADSAPTSFALTEPLATPAAAPAAIVEPALAAISSAPVLASTLSVVEPAAVSDLEPSQPSVVKSPGLPTNATILLASADARALSSTSDSVTLQAPSFLDQAEASLDRITTPLLEFVASGFSPSPAMITGFSPASTFAVAPAPATDAHDASSTQAMSPRHARLLNTAVAYEADEKDLAQARDRVVHRLSDSEELYASVTRLGVRGDRLSLSF